MERLWAPWRRSFVEGSVDPQGNGSCFLCQVPSDEASADRRNLLVYRGQLAFVVLNKYPYNNGHVLIAPYQHTGELPSLAPEIALDMTLLTRWCVAGLKSVYKPDGFNVGMNLGSAAGAGVPDHLHTHVVPRWTGDTNFLPVTGETKVMPESLEQTYSRFRDWAESAPGPYA